MSSKVELEIVYQDDDILILNKPPDIVVNRADTVAAKTVQDWMEQHLPQWHSTDWQDLIPADFSGEFGDPESIFQERLGVVHRLDKDTSGVLLLAKNPGALVNLLAQFKQRQVQKKYMCLAHGKFVVPQDTLSLPMGRASQNRLLFAVRPEGREAVTTYEVKEFFPHLDLEKIIKFPAAKGSNFKKRSQIYQGFSLVECWPHTGRTHQIRVHLAYIKHPLVGDVTYVGRKRQVLDPIWCPRQFLHASELTFTHPRTRQSLTITAPLSPDLEQVLTVLTD